MYQVKIFQRHSWDCFYMLEAEINEWLKDNDVEVIDIRYATHEPPDPEEDDSEDIIIILYK